MVTNRLIYMMILCFWCFVSLGCDTSETQQAPVIEEVEPTVEMPGDDWARVDLGPLSERRDFLTATALVSSGVGRKADESEQVSGAVVYRMPRREAGQALERFGERVLENGCMLIRQEVRLFEGLETLLLLPTDDAEFAIRSIGTQGKSPAVSPAEIVKSYEALNTIAGGKLRLQEIRDQGLQVVLLEEPDAALAAALATKMIEVCPALVERQAYSVETLSEEILETALLDLWWP